MIAVFFIGGLLGWNYLLWRAALKQETQWREQMTNRLLGWSERAETSLL